jgi:hypothetical protein
MRIPKCLAYADSDSKNHEGRFSLFHLIFTSLEINQPEPRKLYILFELHVLCAWFATA